MKTTPCQLHATLPFRCRLAGSYYTFYRCESMIAMRVLSYRQKANSSIKSSRSGWLSCTREHVWISSQALPNRNTIIFKYRLLVTDHNVYSQSFGAGQGRSAKLDATRQQNHQQSDVNSWFHRNSWSTLQTTLFLLFSIWRLPVFCFRDLALPMGTRQRARRGQKQRTNENK